MLRLLGRSLAGGLLCAAVVGILARTLGFTDGVGPQQVFVLGGVLAAASAINAILIARPLFRAVVDGAQRIGAMGQPGFRGLRPMPTVREVRRLSDALEERSRRIVAELAGIRSARDELEAVLTSMVEGVIVLDAERRIRRLNAAAGLLFGRDPDQGVGRTLLQYIRNPELEDFSARVFAAGRPVSGRITVYGQETRHIQINGTRMTSTESGKAIRAGALLVLSDITRIRRLEELRRDFVANVSHELRTPITSIRGFVETLLEGAAADPERAERFLQIILAHTNRLNSIIEDLLSLSRLEQDDEPIPREELRIHEVVNRMREFCQPRARLREISIVDSYTGTGWAVVNRSLLEQALVNLVDNAIKYSPNGSTVRVGVRTRNRDLRVSVTDQGPGIPESERERIFERFYRLDPARSREEGGTGLGLAIVKHIAMVHRGRIWVEDGEQGSGSRFVMSIPAPPDALGEAGAPAESGEPVRSLHQPED